MISADVWDATGGMAAAMNPPASASSPSKTMITAIQRLRPWRVSQATTGSRPAAMKNASPMRISTERALSSSSTRAMTVMTPAVAFIPIMKGERGFSGRPGLGALLALGLGFHECLADGMVLGHLLDAR